MKYGYFCVCVCVWRGFYYDFEACFETSFIVSHPTLALKGFDFISLSNFPNPICVIKRQATIVSIQTHMKSR